MKATGNEQSVKAGSVKMNVGGWELEEFRGIKMPQKAQSAFSAVTSGLTGASYLPLIFCGTQVVNGTNYAFIALQTLILAEPRKRIVKLIVNESLDGKYSIVNINSIGIKN